MTAGKPPWIVLVTAFCLVLGFGGVALVGASGAPAAALRGAVTHPDTHTGRRRGWRSSGPYAGDVQALALSPAFATDGLALAGGAQTGPFTPGGYGIAARMMVGRPGSCCRMSSTAGPCSIWPSHPTSQPTAPPSPARTSACSAAPTAATPGPGSTTACPTARTGHRAPLDACGFHPPSAQVGSRWSSPVRVRSTARPTAATHGRTCWRAACLPWHSRATSRPIKPPLPPYLTRRAARRSLSVRLTAVSPGRTC